MKRPAVVGGLAMLATLIVWGAAMVLPSCSAPDEAARGGGPRPRVFVPEESPTSKSGKRKLTLPPPMPPAPKPDGQPQRPEDFRQLAQAAAAGKPVERPGAPKIVRLDEHRLKIGDTLVDRQAGRIEIPAKVNMDKGILEYFVCTSGGKLHEAVLEQLDQPSHLHLALLLLELEPAEFTPDEKFGERLIRQGSRLKVTVEWKDVTTGKAMVAPAERWLYNRKRKGSPKAIEWAFNGGRFWNGDYSADTAKSVIGLIPDPTVVISSVGNEGNPYQGMEGYEVFTKTIPPKGTPVTLVIQPAGK